MWKRGLQSKESNLRVRFIGRQFPFCGAMRRRACLWLRCEYASKHLVRTHVRGWGAAFCGVARSRTRDGSRYNCIVCKSRIAPPAFVAALTIGEFYASFDRNRRERRCRGSASLSSSGASYEDMHQDLEGQLENVNEKLADIEENGSADPQAQQLFAQQIAIKATLAMYEAYGIS